MKQEFISVKLTTLCIYVVSNYFKNRHRNSNGGQLTLQWLPGGSMLKLVFI